MYLLLAAAAVAFPGGNHNDLAKSINEATSKPVVVVLSKMPEQIKAFSYEPADLDAMARAFRTNTTLVMAPGSNMILHDGLIPADKVAKGVREFQHAAAKPFPETAVVKGMVTFKTEKNEALQLTSLKGFSKPVEVHWFYTGQTIGVVAKDTPEFDFLSHIGKGIGARAVSTTKTFKIDFDPTEVRIRAIRTIQAVEAPDPKAPPAPPDKILAFRIAALNTLTTAQLTQLFSKQGNQVKTPIRSGGDIERQAVALIREQEGNAQTTNDTLPESRVIFTNRPASRSIFARIDPRRQAMLVTDTSFNSWVEVPVRGGDGNNYETLLRPESRIRRER